MRSLRIPSLLLSALLRCLPLARVFALDPAAAPAPVVILLRWLGSATAVAGSFHGVSGASVTLNNPAGGKVTATNGVAAAFRVSMTYTDGGKVISPTVYDAVNLPPGFSQPAKSGSIWRITGTPTQTGTFSNVKVTGYEKADKSGSHKATFTITITVLDAPAAPPVISRHPVDVTVHAGEPVVLSAAATGTGVLTYSWSKDGSPVAGGTGADLRIPEATSADQGRYVLNVTGSGGSSSSTPATVTVVEPLVVGGLTFGSGGFQVPFNGIPGRSYVLESAGDLGGQDWQVVAEQVAREGSSFSVTGLQTDQQWVRVRTK